MKRKNHNKLANLSNQKNTITSVQLQEYSGPLPHPKILSEYKQIDAVLVEKIVQEFEKQSDHRRVEETRIAKSFVRAKFLGQILSFILLTLMISFGAFLILQDKEITGLLNIALGFGGVAWALYGNSKLRQK